MESKHDTTCENTGTPPHTIFVWDFDWTVVNCNSDEYIPAQFMEDDALAEGFRELYQATGKNWHACVEAMVGRAMSEGGADSAQVLDAARQMPYLAGVRQALDDIIECRCDQMILSDGNTLFINTFLNANGLGGHFDHVVSNEGSWDENKDRLVVVHQSQQYGGHDCSTCSANLCKTQALEKTLTQWGFPRIENKSKSEKNTIPSSSMRPRIVYVGDGANDACPVWNILGPGDVMLARSGRKRKYANRRTGQETDDEAVSGGDGDIYGTPFGILPALQLARTADPPVIPKCQVWEWSTGVELRHLVGKLLGNVKA